MGTPREGGNGKDIDWQKIAGKKGNDAEASIPSAQKIAVSELLEKVKKKSKIQQLPVRDDDDDETEIDTNSKLHSSRIVLIICICEKKSAEEN